MTRLWDAIDLLAGGDKWRKGDLWDRNGNHCLLGAIKGVKSERGNTYYGFDKGQRHYADAKAVAKVICELHPDLYDESDDVATTVYSFNDNLDRTFDEVRTVLEKAAIRRDEFLR